MNGTFGKIGARDLLEHRKFPDSYVQDGLVAMWDGQWNAGWGKHDPNATVWVNLVNNSPFGNGERIGTGLTSNLPIWTDKSCYAPEFASGYNVKACFNVSATLDDTLSVVCGETVARAKNIDLGQWNVTAMLGCDVRFCMDNTHLVKPAATKSYSATQFQCWDYNAGNLGLDPGTTRSYHVRKVGTSKLGIMANGGTEYQGGISNGRTENMRTYWPIIYTNNVIVEVFCIRYYSRELTSDEIARNYSIDKLRFNLT